MHNAPVITATNIEKGAIADAEWSARDVRQRSYLRPAGSIKQLVVIDLDAYRVVSARGDDAGIIKSTSVEPQPRHDHASVGGPAVGHRVVDLRDRGVSRERSRASEHIEFALEHGAARPCHGRWYRSAGAPTVGGDVIDLQVGDFTETRVTAGNVQLATDNPEAWQVHRCRHIRPGTPAIAGDVIDADRVDRPRPVEAAGYVNLPVEVAGSLIGQSGRLRYGRPGAPGVGSDVIDTGCRCLRAKGEAGDVIDLAPAWCAGGRSCRRDCRCGRWRGAAAQPCYSKSVARTACVMVLAYHHYKCLTSRNFNIERLPIQIREGAYVSNPVVADVVRIEAWRISRSENVMVSAARRTGIDRHALSCTGGVGERVRIVTEAIRIAKDRARRSRRTGLRNTACDQFISLRRIASFDGSVNDDRSAGRATRWRRRRRATPAYRPKEPVNLIRYPGVDAARGTSLTPSQADTKTAARILPGRRTVGLHRTISPTPLAKWSKIHFRLHGDPIRPGSKRDGRTQSDTEGGPGLHIRHTNKFRDQRTRKTAAIDIYSDIKARSRSGAVEIHPIRLNRIHVPSLARRHHEIVRQLVVKRVQ